MLILADTPEKLGEWRRGLQDCLGISRSDFGPSRGIVLFETPEALVQKGDRIVAQEDLPLVIMDLDDDRVSLSLLKFPLWLAFAPQKKWYNPKIITTNVKQLLVQYIEVRFQVAGFRC